MKNDPYILPLFPSVKRLIQIAIGIIILVSLFSVINYSKYTVVGVVSTIIGRNFIEKNKTGLIYVFEQVFPLIYCQQEQEVGCPDINPSRVKSFISSNLNTQKTFMLVARAPKYKTLHYVSSSGDYGIYSPRVETSINIDLLLNGKVAGAANFDKIRSLQAMLPVYNNRRQIVGVLIISLQQLSPLLGDFSRF